MSIETFGAAGPAPPQVGDGELFALHPRAPALWLVQAVAGIVAFSVPAAGAAALSGLWPLAALVPLVAATVVLVSGVYGRAYVRHFRCRLLADGLLIERGVWWRSETFVPRARIQHTDVEEGPLQRKLGMATLEVYTAGTHASRLAVHGLSRDAALRLRDRLLGRGGHDAVLGACSGGPGAAGGAAASLLVALRPGDPTAPTPRRCGARQRSCRRRHRRRAGSRVRCASTPW